MDMNMIRKKKFISKAVAWFMALLMVISLLPAGSLVAEAETGDTINLGNAVWKSKEVTYYFPNVKASFAGEQKILCISVDNDGYFTIPDTSVFPSANVSISGLELTDEGSEYVGTAANKSNPVTTETHLTSLSIILRDASVSADVIQTFLRGVTFYRNGVVEGTEQTVTAISSSVQLDEDMTAVAVDGKLHYYKYINFTDNKYGITKQTWYESYEYAKTTYFNGLKGYLATITSDFEQTYLYAELGGRLEAWIGGARTSNDTVVDGDTIVLNPGEDDNPEAIWYWVDGPEAGKSFYAQLKENNHISYFQGDETVDIDYSKWNTSPQEPNNQRNNDNGIDTKNQEYALEYGYHDNGEWNDYNPTNMRSEYTASGLLIEFSPYKNSNDSAYPDGYTEEEPPAIDTKTIPLAMIENPSLGANDFIVSKADASSASNDKVKGWADVTATDSDGTDTVSTVTVTTDDTDQTKTISDGEQITFTNPAGLEPVTVTATVRDEANSGTGKTSNAQISIGANNFEITKEQEAKIVNNTVTDTDTIQAFKELSAVAAKKNGVSVDADDISIKSVVKTGDGQYNVTYSYDGVDVIVVASTISNPHINAYDFVISKETAEGANGSGVSKGDLIQYASVEATDEDGKNVDSDDIEVNVKAPAIIKEGDTFTFTNPTDSNTSTNTATATASVRDEANDETASDGVEVSIGGNNFTITSAELAELGTASGDALYKEKAKAVAFANGVSVPVEDIEVVSFVKTSQENVYDVTFAYDGVTTTVKATVEVPYVNAKDFIVTKDEATSTSGDKIKDYSQATAVEGTINNPVAVDKSEIAITGDTSKITDGAQYTFTYSGVSDTATANVVDKKNSTELEDGTKITIGANNFVTNVIPDSNTISDEIKKLFKELADVKATDSSVTDGTIPWSSDEITVKSVVPSGTDNEYDVTFSYKGDEVTVKATYDPSKTALKSAQTDTSEPTVGTPITLTKITDENGEDVPIDNTNASFQWQISDDGGKTWRDIDDETSPSYTPTADDEGKSIRCEVTGTGSYIGTVYAPEQDGMVVKKAEAESTTTALKSAQTDTTEPTVGTPITLTKITDENGKDVPLDNKNASFQWQVSDDGGKTWKNIDDATSISYTPTASDEGKKIRCEVTGTGAYTGTVYAPSEAGATVTKVEDPVVVDKNPTSITIAANPDYEYKLLDKQGNVVKDWTTDAGANDGDKKTGTITFTNLDENTEYQVVSRKKGDTATSNPVSVSTSASKGLELAKETLTTSKPQVGTTVKVKTVTDKNGNTVALTGSNVTYQWQYYKNGKWVNISGATGQSYKVPTSMTGYMLRCAVTGVNDYKGTVYAQTEGVSAELNIPTITMKKNLGKKKKFQVKLLNTKGATIRFSSSNPKVATINKKGVVTGKKYGKTTIVINITKGKRQAQYRVVVSVKKSVKKNLSLVKYKTSYKSPSVALYKLMNKKQTYKIKLAHITKKDKVTYSSSNKRIATVDKKGKVTARRTGRADITIKVVHNGITYEYFMVVRVIKNGKKENNTNYLKVIK